MAMMTMRAAKADDAAADTRQPGVPNHSLRLFLADGHPRGLVVADLMNWSGKVLKAPRGGIDRLLRRPEVSRTGLYILMWPDPERETGTRADIGEADDVATRIGVNLRQGRQDFFDQLAAIVSSDDHLTKAHVRYLEAKLIRRARDAKAVTLSNVTSPDYQLLPEADRASMDYFFDQLMLVLPLIGFDIFASATMSPAPEDPAPSPNFIFSTGGATARARETEEGFVILAGSTARRQPSATLQAGYQALRENLIEAGKLIDDGDHRLLRFLEDIVFSSPSAAAAIVAARSASGPREWKVQETSQTYMEWKAAILDCS